MSNFENRKGPPVPWVEVAEPDLDGQGRINNHPFTYVDVRTYEMGGVAAEPAKKIIVY